MNKDGIISKVRTIMNETGAEEGFTLISEDTVKLSEYIESVIPDAINIIMGLKDVDPIFLNPTSGGTTSSTSGNCTVVKLPDDFLRFVSLKCSGWKREVQTIFPYGGEEYKIQHNSVTTSGVNKPSCVYAYSGNGASIECFPSGTLEYFYYIKKMSDSDTDLTGISDRLFGSICYMCAYLVYNIFEMANTGQQMYNIALQNIPQNE